MSILRLCGLSSADAQWQAAKASLSGTVGLTGARPLDLALNLDGVDVKTLLDVIGQPDRPVSGVFAAEGKVSGTTARPVADVHVQGSNLVAYDETLGALSADIGLVGRDVTVSRLAIDKPQPGEPGRVTGTASYNIDRGTYTANLTSDHLRLLGLTLPGGQRIRGTVDLEANGSGRVASPAGTVKLVANDLEIDGLNGPPADDSAEAAKTAAVGRVTIAATAANGQATINASAPRFNVDADGRVGLSQPFPATVQLRAKDLDLASLPFDLQTPLTGQLRGTIDATGDLADPARGEATASIDAFSGAWNDQPFSVTSPSRLRYAGERLDIERLQLSAGDSSAVIHGQLPLTDRAGAGELAVEAHANLATLAQYLPKGTDLTGDGAVTLTGTLRGTLKSIDPDLVITVDDGLVLSPELEPGLSNIQLRARVANGDGRHRTAAGELGQCLDRRSGTHSARGAAAVAGRDIRGKADRPRSRPRFGASTRRQFPARPLVSADASAWTCKPPRAAPDLAALEGTITFPELQVGYNGLALTQQEPSTIRLASGTATCRADGAVGFRRDA